MYKKKEYNLESLDKKEFVEKIKMMLIFETPEFISDKIWDLKNKQWSKGYNQGKYDPNFDLRKV